jgi:acyl carrier protein
VSEVAKGLVTAIVFGHRIARAVRAVERSVIAPRRVEPAGRAGGIYRAGGTHMDDIETKVIEIVSEQMGVDKSEITRETHFINDLNADSLDTVELVMEFEDEFELSIPDEEAEKIQTVGQAIDYIKEHSSK